MEKEGQSSRVDSAESQLAVDEAIARALQELENQLAGQELGSQLTRISFSESSETEAGNDGSQSEITPLSASTVSREHNSVDTTSVRQDSIDPDNMTYEELQSLGETIGTQSRGLSEELISYLPSFKYKTRFFSRRDKNEECVICYMAYKNRDLLITLPCQHQYHSKCVTRWLKLNKACPVCNEEVFGS